MGSHSLISMKVFLSWNYSETMLLRNGCAKIVYLSCVPREASGFSNMDASCILNRLIAREGDIQFSNVWVTCNSLSMRGISDNSSFLEKHYMYGFISICTQRDLTRRHYMKHFSSYFWKHLKMVGGPSRISVVPCDIILYRILQHVVRVNRAYSPLRRAIFQ